MLGCQTFTFQVGVFRFFTGGSSILNSNQHVWQWKEEAMLHEIHMRDFKSHFQRDFLVYCTRPVTVHLAMASVGCSLDSFSIFLLSLKQQQNLKKIMFFCIHFPIWPNPPKILRKKTVFYTGKLYGWTDKTTTLTTVWLPTSCSSEIIYIYVCYC